jgi:hypothetical protein
MTLSRIPQNVVRSSTRTRAPRVALRAALVGRWHRDVTQFRRALAAASCAATREMLRDVSDPAPTPSAPASLKYRDASANVLFRHG